MIPYYEATFSALVDSMIDSVREHPIRWLIAAGIFAVLCLAGVIVAITSFAEWIRSIT